MQKTGSKAFYNSARRPPLTHRLLKVWNPSWFQGRMEKKNYFEGWYLKSVSADGKHSWAFIPGISLNETDSHSFVQVINGKTGQTWYFHFPLKDFQFSGGEFNVSVGENYFSSKGLKLNLKNETCFFKGSLDFGKLSRYPVTLRRPGIMGWYRYVPFMECYHGVVSLDHLVNGEIKHQEGLIRFEKGLGYIEKDWGTSMPEAWIWMQTNHFDQPGTSFMLSIAKIPWLGSSFNGFLGFFYHQGRLFPFATYTGARVEKITETSQKLFIEIKAPKFRLEIEALHGERGSLKAPVSGNMERIIHESIDASIQLSLFDKRGKVLFEGLGIHTGFEMVGDLGILSD